MTSTTKIDNQTVMLPSPIANADFTLSPNEMGIFLTALGRIPQTLQLAPDTQVRISAIAFCKVRNMDSRTGNRALKLAMETLWEGKFTIRDLEDGSITKYRWVSSVKSIEDSPDFEITFNPLILPFISELKTYFTSSLLSIGGFKHTTSYRLYYTIMASRKNHFITSGELLIITDKFLEKYSLEGGAYEKYSVLRSKLLAPAIKELLAKGLFVELRIEKVKGAKEFTLVWELPVMTDEGR